MRKVKLEEVCIIICLFQILLQIVFLIWGVNFESNSNVINTNFLNLLTKVQTNSPLQNFAWCFSNNLIVMFIIFWINYWTFGILGTLWCANSSFMLGSLIKYSLVINSWLSICFILLELIDSLIIISTSTYFRFERFKFKKFCKENNNVSNVNIEDEKRNAFKEKTRKNILVTFAIVACVLLIAAMLETVVLSYLIK